MRYFAEEIDMSPEEVLKNENDELSAFYDSYPQDVAFKYEDTIESLIKEVPKDNFYSLFGRLLSFLNHFQ